MVANPRSLFTSVNDYFRYESGATTRSEYVDGEIVAMACGSLEHSQIIQNLATLLANQIVPRGCRVLTSDMLVKGAATRYYYPDVVVLCGQPTLERRQGIDVLTNPRIVVEVLYSSTELRDRREKRLAYMQSETIEEILLVAQDAAYVERLRRNPDGEWILDTITGLDSILTLVSIESSISLRTLYQFVITDEAPTVSSEEDTNTL